MNPEERHRLEGELAFTLWTWLSLLAVAGSYTLTWLFLLALAWWQR